MHFVAASITLTWSTVDPPGAGARMRTQNEGNAGAGARIPKRQDPQGSAGNHPNPYQGNAREREDLQDEQEQEQENNPRRPRSTGSLSGTVVAQLAQVLGSLGAVQSMDSGETLEEEPDDAISSLQPDSAISMQLDSAISMQPDSAISMQQEQTLHQHQQHNAGSSLRRAANAVSVQPHSTCNSMQEGQTQHQPDTTISVTQPTEVKPLVQTTKKKRSNAEVDVVHREARRATYVSKRDPFYVFIQLPVAIQVYIKGRFQTQTEQTQLMHKYLNRLFDLLGDVQKQVVMACEEGERFVLIKDALIEKFKESGYEEDGAENELQALLSDVSHL